MLAHIRNFQREIIHDLKEAVNNENFGRWYQIHNGLSIHMSREKNHERRVTLTSNKEYVVSPEIRHSLKEWMLELQEYLSDVWTYFDTENSTPLKKWTEENDLTSFFNHKLSECRWYSIDISQKEHFYIQSLYKNEQYYFCFFYSCDFSTKSKNDIDEINFFFHIKFLSYFIQLYEFVDNLVQYPSVIVTISFIIEKFVCEHNLIKLIVEYI